ncbi:MAG: type II toxin-antitoxin system VapC family toxin [Solirubrobacterales bacterium]|nr:type II toxin-antitoxin system VapC family toxin [Solirubrobacterales bacterium]
MFKLVGQEAESDGLRAFLSGADLVSSELVLAEVPRAVHRAVSIDSALPLDQLIEQAGEVIEALALRAVDRHILSGAGAIAEPALRTLDAVHVASAISLSLVEAFVTYDERQAAVARLAGLRTLSPGV